MKKTVNVLIADRNPHVRGFLQRELLRDGLHVLAAKNAQALIDIAFGSEPVDIIVLDPDFSDMETNILMEKIVGRIPSIPIILHTLPGEEEFPSARWSVAHIVEKDGKSIERIKKIIADIFSWRVNQGKKDAIDSN